VVKRLIKLSVFMYTEENDSTFAEIRITVIENANPIGSIIIVNMMGVLSIVKIFHSRSIIWFS
jgi:hypothetical protein